MPYGYRVFTETERPSQALLDRFAQVATPDLADVMQHSNVVDGEIRPIYQPMARFVGTAITVNLPDGAFNVLKMGMEVAQAGDVLVLAARGNLNYALIGGNVSKGMKRRGLAGVIIDGCARDIDEIRAVDLPVYARGIHISSGPKSGPGEINVPVAFGHCVIFPGDIIVADEEGITVVPPAFAEDILERLKALKGWHASVQPALERGEVTNIAAIRKDLEASGCEFFQRPYGR